MIDLYLRSATPIFWATLVLVYAVAIMPSPYAPDFGAGDKLNHIAAFVGLTLLGRFAYRERPALRLAVGLSLFGALIEFTQAIPALNRDASFWDWAADSLAILAALMLALVLEHRLRKRRAA